MSDFSDTTLVAGTITGLRAFKVDSLGRLTGCAVEDVWRPGENVAECRKRELAEQQMRRMTAWGGGPTFIHSAQGTVTTTEAPQDEPKHRVAARDCQCGYYAYFNGDNNYAAPGRVSAIVEGYGHVTVGSKGFRAEKARILALIVTLPPVAEKVTYALTSTSDKKPQLKPWHGSLVSSIGLAISAVAQLIGALAKDNPPLFTGAIGAAIAGVLLGVTSRVQFKTDQLERESKSATSQAVQFFAEPQDEKPVNTHLISRNYPEVPIYRSFGEALAAHPLTPPPPPTPADDDFWTRSAS